MAMVSLASCCLETSKFHAGHKLGGLQAAPHCQDQGKVELQTMLQEQLNLKGEERACRGESRLPLKASSEPQLWNLNAKALQFKVSRVSDLNPVPSNLCRVDTRAVQAQRCNPTEDNIPVLTLSKVVEQLDTLRTPQRQKYLAMYSSVIGAITTDPAAMFIPLDDHMVHRGHGVFDTAIIHNECLYELDVHLDRILTSAAMAKIMPPFDRTTLRSILLQTVVASGCREGSLRYWLSAGLGGFGLSSSECYKSTFYAVVIDVKYLGPEGVKVVTSTIPIKPPKFANMKSTNYLPNVLAQLEAEEVGAFTSIWLDQEGYIAEGPNMNVAFLSKDGVLTVPPYDNVLAGCTVRRVLEIVPKLVDENLLPGLVGVKIQRITVEDAKEAVEMMLIGSGVLVKPVVEWDGQPVGNGQEGPLTLAIREAVQKDLEDPGAGVLVSVPYKDGFDFEQSTPFLSASK